MRKLSILALTATIASAPAFAETGYYSTVTPTTQSSQLVVNSAPNTIDAQADLSFAFDDVENLQAVVMTDKQMKETEGAWLPVAVALNVGGRFVTNQLAKHYINNTSLAYGTYAWGKSQGKQGK